MRPISAGSLTAGLLLLLVVACGGEPGADAPSVTVRDSAGIRIVENSGPVWGEGEAWAVESEPEWVVGYEEELLLSGVQVVDVHPDGRVSVAHGSVPEVVVLSPDGSMLTRIGRRGEGPGEFEEILAAYWMPGDTLMAIDWGANRLSFFSPDGALLRTAMGSSSPRGVLDDGTLVFGDWILGEVREDRVAESRLTTMSNDLDDERDLGRIATAECTGTSTTTCPLDSFGAFGPIGVGADRIVHGFGREYVIRSYDPQAGLVQIARLDREPVPVDGAMIERYREHWVESGEDPERLEQSFERRGGPPDALPHFMRVVVDRAGFSWLQENEMISDAFELSGPYPRPTVRWGVFDPEGAFLGRVEIPARLEVQAIGPDYLIGIYRDEYDVETIRRYRLDRG